MRRYDGIAAACFAVLALAPAGRAAFEPAPESPWLQGGAASRVFPVSPLVLFGNPASLGLLERSGAAVAASRPFGLRRLDRAAAAGGLVGTSSASGLGLSVTGDGSYSESSLLAAFAWRARSGLALGVGVATRHLQIGSYGRATGFTADLGAVWSPVRGLFAAAVLRSAVRTDLGGSGDPAAPRVLEAAIGLAPVRGVTVSVGAARQERLPPEVSIATSFSPAAPAVLSAGLLTDPARFWAALIVSIDRLDVGYGYAEHPDLPGGHSVALCWGGCRADPAPVDWEEEEPAEETPDFPIDANTATAEQLDLIPGIGPSRAATLVSWIRENGPISSVEELDGVPGIGPSLLAVLREYLVAE